MLLYMAEDAEVGSNGNGDENKTVEKSPSSKKLNISTGYFISLYSKKALKCYNWNYSWAHVKLLS